MNDTSNSSTLTDDHPRRYAVIDIGTNSVKFHLGEKASNGSWTTLVDRSEVTRLGEGHTQRGMIHPAAIERTVTAIETMADEAKQHDAVAIVAVATAGMRLARNQADVITGIHERTGLILEILTGDEEAELAYLAVPTATGPTDQRRVVFDTGGGSSQFTFGTERRIADRFSVDVGAARYTEQFDLQSVIASDKLQRLFDEISTDLAVLNDQPVPDAMVGLGGAITTMAAVSLGMGAYDAPVIHGSSLGLTDVGRQIEMYRAMDASERSSISGVQRGRSEVILAGACIVRTVMVMLDQQVLTVSDRSLRHGIAIQRFGAQFSD